MNRLILAEVKKELNQRKVDAIIFSKDAEKKAMAIPKVKELYEKKKELTVEIGYASFENKNTDSLKKKQEETTIELEKILKKYNMKISDFENVCVCHKCSDKGFIGGEICDCAKIIASKILLQKSGFKHKLHSFEEFDVSLFEESNKKNMIKTFEEMKIWCNNPMSEIKTILFAGATGTGKTFIMECMADQLMKNNEYVNFTTAFAMLNDCVEYRKSFDEEKNDILEPYLECDILFIDDLGTEAKWKGVTDEFLLMIINERSRNSLRTVISTNLMPEQIENVYDERLFSRLFNKRISKAYLFTGKDLRINYENM